MNTFSIKEFMPTIKFLGKFVGIYVVANLLYALFVAAYDPRPDIFTDSASVQTAMVLKVLGWPAHTFENPSRATTIIALGSRQVLSVYEGCNGVNVMIIFLAFLFAFGPMKRTLFWFIPAGIIVIHLANLGRITGLFWIALYQPHVMYFFHKYLFTAILYIVVFVLWIVWVKKFARDTTLTVS